MKISFYSDLHTEFDLGTPWYPPVIPEVDVVILAGDCFVAGYYDDVSWLKTVITQQREKQIIYVPGNHDFYGATSMETFHRSLEILEDAHKRFHYLNNKSVDIGGVMFHGTPLWTTFEAYGPVMGIEAMQYVRNRIADFSRIPDMTPEKMSSLGYEAKNWLRKSLEVYKNHRNIVVTHFPPVLACENPHYDVSPLSPYFNNHLSWLSYLNVEMFIYGHNHYNRKFEWNDVTFLCNQKGYPKEGRYMGDKFDPNIIVEI